MSTMDAPGDGPEGESLLREAFAEFGGPDSVVEQALQSSNPSLYITSEDYSTLPEERFQHLNRARVALETDWGTMYWRMLGSYGLSAIVKQEAVEDEEFEPGYMVVGGSIYMGETQRNMLTDEDGEAILSFAWQQQKVEAAALPSGVSFVVAPGIICQNAQLYFHQAMTFEEMREPDMVEATLQKPMSVTAISFEREPGRTMTLFVPPASFLSASVRALYRQDGDMLLQRFGQV